MTGSIRRVVITVVVIAYTVVAMASAAAAQARTAMQVDCPAGGSAGGAAVEGVVGLIGRYGIRLLIGCLPVGSHGIAPVLFGCFPVGSHRIAPVLFGCFPVGSHRIAPDRPAGLNAAGLFSGTVAAVSRLLER